MTPRLSLIATAILVVSGCGPEREYSDPTTEPGKVAKLVFVPSGHGSDTAAGIGTDGNGNMTTSITPVNIDIPARYGIVFECPHGSFAIEGDKWESLWKSLHEGQKVAIQYRTVYELDRDTKERKFVKLDFLGATPEATAERGEE